MAVMTDDLPAQALQLSDRERARLSNALQATMDRPHPEIDALSVQEAERRLAALRAGEDQLLTEAQVFEGIG